MFLTTMYAHHERFRWHNNERTMHPDWVSRLTCQECLAGKQCIIRVSSITHINSTVSALARQSEMLCESKQILTTVS